MDAVAVKKEALKQVELLLEKAVEAGKVEELVNLVKVEVEKAIPGTVDDMVIELVVPKLIPVLKAALLAQIEKISEEV